MACATCAAVLQEAITECREALGDRTVADLDALPEWLSDDGRVRFTHASPISDLRSFAPEPAEEDEELLGGHTEPLQVFGHTHVPFERTGPHGIRLVNPGSVGMPMDGDQRASWAILHVVSAPTEWSISFRVKPCRSTKSPARWIARICRRPSLSVR